MSLGRIIGIKTPALSPPGLPPQVSHPRIQPTADREYSGENSYVVADMCYIVRCITVVSVWNVYRLYFSPLFPKQ